MKSYYVYILKCADGGKTWKKTLFANEHAGIVDLLIDPTNPRILYASTWRVQPDKLQ